MTNKERLIKHMLYLRDLMDDAICSMKEDYMKAVLEMFVHYSTKLLNETKGEKENE